jgi:hypothetical protein
MTGIVTWLKHMARGIAVSLPLVAAFGYAFPWPAGEAAIQSRHPGQFPIMIAFFSHSHSWHSARSHRWVTETSRTRSYILLPSVFVRPGIVIASQENDGPPVVSEATVPVAIVAVPGAIVLCLLGFWYVSTRPARYRLSAREAGVIYGRGSLDDKAA